VNIDNRISKLKSFVAEDLQKMDQLIKELLENRESLIPMLANYLISSGGKRLRPVLTLLVAKMFDYAGNQHINLAAAIEFIHSATLLHDDVIDESSLRRGVATANSKWGSKASILVGDFLLSQSFQLMVQSGSLKILDILSHISAMISEGEIRQLVSTHNLQVTDNDYIAIITAKTAVLFAAAAQIGAVVSQRSAEEEMALYNFGLELGIAFQIIDDTLDYAATQETLGKAIGDDFLEGKVTLPVIIAYHKSDEVDKSFWQRTITDFNQEGEDLQTAIGLMEKHDAFVLSFARAKQYATKAAGRLDIFPEHEVKTILLDILTFALERSF
jgi:octaprenyl-diphosphate synthase